MAYRRTTASDRSHIREVFLRPEEVYGLKQVSGLLRLPDAAIHAAVEQGIVAVLGSGSEAAIGWEDVVMLGLEHRWTPRMFTEALRGPGIHVLPPLVRVRAGRVFLPHYQWKLLRLIAAQRSRSEERDITVSDLIEDAISTAVITKIEDWTTLEASQPGLRAAAEWPAGESGNIA